MSIKRTALWITSRLVQGAGMGITLCCVIGAVASVFMAEGGYRYLYAGGCVVGAIAGYYLYKIAILKIYDDRPDDWL